MDKPKVEVGQVLFLVDYRRKGSGDEVEVVKVGRKYFSVKPVDKKWTVEFFIDSWKQKSDFPSYALWASKKEREDYNDRKVLEFNLKEAFRHYSHKYSHNQLRLVAQILDGVEESDVVLMPRDLTAENGAKGLLIGEFSESLECHCYECDGTGLQNGFDCEVCDGDGRYLQPVVVGWTTIKDIYKMAVKHLGDKL